MVTPDTAEGEIRHFLNEIEKGALDAESVIRHYDISRIDEMLRPAIEASGAEGLPKWTGGIFGAPGAAVGRACFSSAALMEAQKQARLRGADPRCMLVLPSVFATDVAAMEAAEGSLTAQGGYASHAAVLARQYGKPSMVAPALSIAGTNAVLGDLRFSEGDFITLDAQPGESAVYLGAADLRDPETGLRDLLEFVALARGFIKKIRIRANVETPEEAERALFWGADGIGLCRTEHMFFKGDRLNSFRALILSESRSDRDAALEKLQVMQRGDFYRIFKIMAGKSVAVRLLDAPLHEFMPRGAVELDNYLDYCSKSAGMPRSKDAVIERIAALRESNPMLGHRGCRVAASHPEIYAMQIRSLFDAARQARDESIAVRLEIIVPLVMNAAELRLIAYGKRAEGALYAGIADLAEAFRNETGADAPPYKIGAMIELPAAALQAGDIARHAQFFSFGTNDLTQTALGLSRDDAANFLGDYSRYDLLAGNPFRALDDSVKELIALAVERGRLTRPDLACGLCGEQAADPATLRFCLGVGLDYVSCPPRAVPAAILAAAKAELAAQEQGATSYAGTRT
jgi:pyruvate,orthophosphate dikinase